ncbi:MAG: hypothetical protein M4579_007504 [Chaenotheca gracillima]|nr:MAG: hypothetical protein M4579_007504 [Chaenotheca gracillima]
MVKRISETAKGDVRELGRMPDSFTVYDNFEQTMGVKEQQLGSNSEFHSVTTGLVIKDREMPPEGLRQDMLKPTVRLQARDIYLADGNQMDNVHLNFSNYPQSAGANSSRLSCFDATSLSTLLSPEF